MSAAEQTLRAPASGTVVQLEVSVGQHVASGQVLLALESMKMDVPLAAPSAGIVSSLGVGVGEVVREGDELLRILARPEPEDHSVLPAAVTSMPAEHPSFAEWAERRAMLPDSARPHAVATRHAAGRRMVRENLDDLFDEGSFTEYGAFAVAAQRSRRPLEDLQRETPADGVVTGVGRVAGRAVATVAYDYTVLAGTQGVFNHRKCDRLLDLAERQRLPVVLFAEGGGGRPGDVDWLGVAGLDCTTFARLAALSGVVPLIGIVAGRCFAGNAALLGVCDLIIAVEGSSIGMGGPAMIEGGGLGRVEADAVGPVPALAAAGVIDLRMPDEAAAVAAAKQILAMHGGPSVARDPAFAANGLRSLMPATRQSLIDVPKVLRSIFDSDSLLDLRPEFGASVVTALARLDGHPVAVAASQARHKGGALDAEACDKLARLMQLADAAGWPLVTLVDTPGFMVGPEAERAGMVRHAARVFVHAAALRVPVASVVLRRGFGLGAMALTAGHFHAPAGMAAWPCGEFGPMGLEGAVRLGYRKELQAAPEGEREALFRRLLAEAVERGRALNMASHLEIDDVIDPADTRDWLVRVLAAARERPLPSRRAVLDPW